MSLPQESRLTDFGPTMAPANAKGRHAWHVYACACGWLGKMLRDNVTHGKTKSCGCLRDALASERAKTHGHTIGGKSKTYSTWRSMHARTSNPNVERYPRYGGRGIVVCDRWSSFENFLSDMGERPVGKSLDRKNNDGNYTPENCHWASSIEQGANTSVSLRFSWEGREWSLAELAKHADIKPHTLRTRMKVQGWSLERALTTPVLRTRKVS